MIVEAIGFLAHIFRTYLLYVFLVIFCLYYLTASWNLSYWKRKGIFSMPASPFMGQMFLLINRGKIGVVEIDKYYRLMKAKGKNILGIYETLNPVAVLTDIDLIQKVLIKDFDHFVDRRTFALGTEDGIISEMLTSVQGTRWKKLRAVLTPTFTSGKMKTMFHLVRERAVRTVVFCENACKNGEALDFVDILGKYSIDAIGSVAFGLEIDSINGGHKDFVKAAKRTTNLGFLEGMKLLVMFMVPRAGEFFNFKFTNEGHDFLEKVVIKIIEERRVGQRRNDFIDILLDARKQAEEDKSGNVSYKLTDQTIFAQAVLFILGGFDTTSTSLSFIMKALSVYPEYQKLIRDELKEKMARDGRDQLSYEDVMEARWLEGFTAETLRMYPVAPALERKCTKEYPVPDTDFTIPVDMMVNIPTMSIHFDEDIFPEPYEFRPERFFPENKHSIPTVAYLPFGVGPRMCIAQRFAQMQMKIAVAEFVLNHVLVAPEGFQDIKLSSKPGLARLEKDTVMIRVEKLVN